MKCKFCEGELEPWLSMPMDAKKDEVTDYRDFVRCDKCRSAIMHPMPPADVVPSFYELPAYYTQGAGHMPDQPVGIMDRALIKLAWWRDKETPFQPFAEAKAGESVLDLGCGDGKLLAKFRSAGCVVTGVDPDPRAIAEATKAGIVVLLGTAESPPSALVGQTFDLVVMTHSLEHCVNPTQALQNAAAFVAPGGRLYVEVPNCGCVHFETMKVCSENFDSPRHLVFFTSDGLKSAVERAGLIEDSWRYHGFTRHHSPYWRNWETKIARQLKLRGFKKHAVEHNLLRSLTILAKSAFASDRKKYDAMGLLARKPLVRTV